MKPFVRTFGILALSFLASSCASLSGGPDDPVRLEPGDTVDFEGETYRLMLVQDDFILMRYLDSGTAGGLSGFMDEVIRVSRYELRTGRWNSEPGKPELRMQWAGGDAFVLDHQIKGGATAPAMGL